MYLGIEQHTGLIYEGTGNPDIPAIPMPSVAHAKIIETPGDWASLPGPHEAFGLVFREDSFDAVSRTRRGAFIRKRKARSPRHTQSPLIRMTGAHSRLRQGDAQIDVRLHVLL